MMTLADMRWRRVSLDRVVLAWLRAERHSHVAPRIAGLHQSRWRPANISALLDNADLDNSNENRARLRLLYIIRNLFLVEIPPDTTWYEVRNLRSELHAVNYASWNDPRDQNELPAVALRKPLPLQREPSEWEPPILWGHGRNGPFTILEGNHRLTAYAGSGRDDIDIPVFIGLSPMSCIWLTLDNCPPLMQDLLV